MNETIGYENKLIYITIGMHPNMYQNMGQNPNPIQTPLHFEEINRFESNHQIPRTTK